MELLEITCPRCGYSVSLLMGTQDPDQTFSDLNEDFAYYRLFLCPVDRAFHSINIHDREFDGDCPEHKGTKLESLKEIPTTCPKCGGEIQVVKKEILKPQGGE